MATQEPKLLFYVNLLVKVKKIFGAYKSLLSLYLLDAFSNRIVYPGSVCILGGAFCCVSPCISYPNFCPTLHTPPVLIPTLLAATNKVLLPERLLRSCCIGTQKHMNLFA